MVVLRHSRETALLSTTNISVARQHFSATGRDITSPRAARQREEEVPIAAGGRHAIAEPAGEQACASRTPPGGTARECAHPCAPGTPPAEAPWSAHPRAPGTPPGESSWPAPPYAPATPPGESSWPAPPYAPATPPASPRGQRSRAPPRRTPASPRRHHSPTPSGRRATHRARRRFRRTILAAPRRNSSGVLRTTAEPPPNQKPLCHPLTPQHHNDDHHPGALRTLIAERSYARDIGPLTDAARRGIVDCVERGMSAELALALEISARYQAYSWEYVARTLQSVLNGSHNRRRKRHTARGGRQRRIAAYRRDSDAYIATIRG